MWFGVIILLKVVFQAKQAMCFYKVKFWPPNFLIHFLPAKLLETVFLPAKQKVWPPPTKIYLTIILKIVISSLV